MLDSKKIKIIDLLLKEENWRLINVIQKVLSEDSPKENSEYFLKIYNLLQVLFNSTKFSEQKDLFLGLTKFLCEEGLLERRQGAELNNFHLSDFNAYCNRTPLYVSYNVDNHLQHHYQNRQEFYEEEQMIANCVDSVIKNKYRSEPTANELERDAFEFLTGGQLGDYDNFNGDFDDVDNWGGY